MAAGMAASAGSSTLAGTGNGSAEPFRWSWLRPASSDGPTPGVAKSCSAGAHQAACKLPKACSNCFSRPIPTPGT